MMRMMRMLATVVAVAMLAATAGVAKTTDQATFDLVLKGLTAGTLTLSGVQDGNGYAVQGKLASSGVLAFVRKVSYLAKAQGSVKNGRYVPTSYTEKADTGRRQSESVMAYKAGVPQVKVQTPARDPRPGDLDPATQGGTVDPLTALYATLRDTPAASACNSKVTLFDGRRRSQVTLGAPKAAEGGVTCPGEYRRLEGFSEKEMAEKTRFPFTLRLEPVADDMLRVVEVSMDSLYGRASLKRR